MDTIIAASRNQHKIVEIEAITKKFGMTIISRDEAGIPKVEIEEDGETFEENSFKKADEIRKMCGKTTIADDSGLMVDYLGERRAYIQPDLPGKTAMIQRTMKN